MANPRHKHISKLEKEAHGNAHENIGRKIEIACKRLSERALKVLESAMNDEGVDWRYRIEAAKEVLNRAWGKPKQQLEATVTHEGGEALISALREHRERAGMIVDSTAVEVHPALEIKTIN